MPRSTSTVRLSYDDGVEAFGGASSRIDSGPVWQGSDEEEAVDDDVLRAPSLKRT